MRQWLAFSLRRKLTAIILVSIVIPLLALGLFAFIVSSNVTEEKTTQSGIDTLKQMDGSLHFILQDVENMSLFLIGQSDIQQYLSYGNVDEALYSRILGLATNLASSKRYISNITIYPADSESPVTSTSIYASDLSKSVNIREVSNKMWTGVYRIQDYSGDKNVITFIRPLRSIHNYENLGWLAISLDEKEISRFWAEPMLANNETNVVLLNENHVVLSASNKKWLAQDFEAFYPGVTSGMKQSAYGGVTYGKGESKKTILYVNEPGVNWTLVSTIPYIQYSAQNRFILQLTAVAVLLAILISAVLIMFVVQKVTNPLLILARLLTKIDPESPLPVFHVNSTDEISRLGSSYNKLGEHIESLKEKVIHNEVRKKEADMRALQAQINPHFLYNTLSSIQWIALMAGEKRIAEMVGALSDFLRFSLNSGKDFCTVQQEIDHIKNYVQIQQIRYPDKFDTDYLLHPQLLDKYMLKLLLQPLVENAMIHGIQKKEGKGHISVYLESKENRMHVVVFDDGVGMTEERLIAVKESLLQMNPQDAKVVGYGLRNVNERLLLHYGPDSCLELESRLGAGTRISFSIPILEDEHEITDRR
jgi:two-component system sensor histidine kinase YesM